MGATTTETSETPLRSQLIRFDLQREAAHEPDPWNHVHQYV